MVAAAHFNRNSPRFVDVYFCSKKTTQLIHSKKDTISSDLVASWTVHVGDMDQVLHLWRYTGGFAKIDKAQALLENDAVSTFLCCNLHSKH